MCLKNFGCMLFEQCGNLVSGNGLLELDFGFSFGFDLSDKLLLFADKDSKGVNHRSVVQGEDVVRAFDRGS